LFAWPETEVNNDASCCDDHPSQPENQCCDRIAFAKRGIQVGVNHRASAPQAEEEVVAAITPGG